jgi:hypothetical protein
MNNRTTTQRAQIAVLAVLIITALFVLPFAVAKANATGGDHHPPKDCTYFPDAPDCQPDPSPSPTSTPDPDDCDYFPEAPECQPEPTCETDPTLCEPEPCAEGEVRNDDGECVTPPPVVEPEPEVEAVPIPRDPPLPTISKHPTRTVPMYDCGQVSGVKHQRFEGGHWVTVRTVWRNIDTADCAEFVETGL